MRPFFSTLFLCLSLSLSGLAQYRPTTPAAPTSRIEELMIHYRADLGSLQRFYLTPNAPEVIERYKQFYSDYLSRLEALPYESLSTGNKVDYNLFKRDLQEELKILDQANNEVRQLQKWLPFAPTLYTIEKIRRRGDKPDAPKIAQDLHLVNAQLKEQIEVLKKEKTMSIALAYRGARISEDLQRALKHVHEFYNAHDPLYTWWVPKPYATTDQLLGELTTTFRKKMEEGAGAVKDASGIVGKPAGREELLRQLQYEMIPYTPEELVEIANKEFAWCDRELLKASQEMGFGNDWKKAQEKVKNSYVPAGEQPLLIKRLYDESIDFLKKNDLISIPPIADETWRMMMMSPERQLVSPFFLGGETILISYPTNTMSLDAQLMSMRGNNPHFSRSTVHHELIAGHHLQGFMNNRYQTYRNFRTPFWTEGWALYWEFLLWDLGFPQSPEDRIGMLFWRSHRCARIIFSLNYHLGRWTPQQCIDFLVDRVGHERANAEGEVRRSFTGNYGELYQLAYMTGGFQFYALKKELVDSGKMTYKQFHDAVMRENSMPVEMLRSILTDTPLPKNHKASWRFYDIKY